MSYTIRTHQGQPAVFAIATKYNIGGYTFAMEVSDFDNFNSVDTIGTPSLVDGKLVISLTSTEVDATTDAYFRIRATAQDATFFFLAGGNIEYIPGGFEQVHEDDIDENGYLKELSEGIEEHGHMVNDIEDASTVGRNIIVAATAAQVRSLIGAGTSDLILGTTAGTAKVGNYQPTAEDISNATTMGRNVIKASSAAAAQTALGINPATDILPGLLQIGGDLTGTAVSQQVSGIGLANFAYRTATFSTNAEIYGDMEDGPETVIQMPRAGRMLVLFGATVRQPNQTAPVLERPVCLSFYAKSTAGTFINPQDMYEIVYSGNGAAESSIYGFRFITVPTGPITLGLVYRLQFYIDTQAHFRNRWIAGIPC